VSREKETWLEWLGSHIVLFALSFVVSCVFGLFFFLIISIYEWIDPPYKEIARMQQRQKAFAARLEIVENGADEIQQMKKEISMLRKIVDSLDKDRQ
jgi:hypothetical protein